MAKTQVHLSINAEVVQQCREVGLNMSEVCNDSLIQILMTFNKKSLPENCEHKFTWPFATAQGLVKECLKCGCFKGVVLESLEETQARMG